MHSFLGLRDHSMQVIYSNQIHLTTHISAVHAKRFSPLFFSTLSLLHGSNFYFCINHYLFTLQNANKYTQLHIKLNRTIIELELSVNKPPL